MSSDTDRTISDRGARLFNRTRKPGSVRDVTSMLNIPLLKACTENSVVREYLSAKFHLVPSLTRGDVPVTRRRKWEQRTWVSLKCTRGKEVIKEDNRENTGNVRKFASRTTVCCFGLERFRNGRIIARADSLSWALCTVDCSGNNRVRGIVRIWGEFFRLKYLL